MQDLTRTLDQLLDKQFVSAFLRQHGNPAARDQIPRRVILNELQIAELKPLLKPLSDYGKVGLLGSYKQRLLVCDSSCLPDAESEEGIIEFDNVRFTFHKTLRTTKDSEWRPTEERSWLDLRHEGEKKKEPAYSALAAYERLYPKANVTIWDLNPLILAARSKYWVAWSIGVPLLSRLAAKHGMERACILEFARDRSAAIRQRSLRLISYHIPKRLALEVAGILLPDRSKVVRENAADFCRRYWLTELIDDLGERLLVENDAGVQCSLEYAIGLMRDGYYLRKSRNRTFFEVYISKGGPGQIKVITDMTENEIRKQGPENVARDVRKAGCDRQLEWIQGGQRQTDWKPEWLEPRILLWEE